MATSISTTRLNGTQAKDAGKSWTSASKAYQDFSQSFIAQATSQLVRETAKLAPYTKSSRVLDNGCDPGTLTLSVLNEEPSAPILAADISQGMLDLVDAKGLPTVHTKVADAVDLRALGEEDGADGVYSHVLSSFMLQFVTEPWTPVREMRRLLKSGGVFGLVTWGAIDFLETIEVAAKRLDPSIPFKLGMNLEWPRDVEGVEQKLVEMGFEDVKVWKMTIVIPMSAEATIEYTFEGGNPTAQAFLNPWREAGKVDVLRKEALKEMDPPGSQRCWL